MPVERLHVEQVAVVMMVAFGVAGLKKCNYPLAPMVLVIALGDKAEERPVQPPPACGIVHRVRWR